MKGARLRGAMTLDMSWKNGKPTSIMITVDEGAIPRQIVLDYAGKEIASFTTSSGMVKSVSI